MREVFPIAADPASTGTWVLMMVLIAVPLVLIAYFQTAPRNVRFEISPEGLRIRGDLFYSRMIPASDLLTGQARAIDLNTDPDHQLSSRRNGTALPNYKAGWFSLKSGGKALVFIGNAQRVAYIPVRSGYAVMLSVADPERLIAALPQSQQQ